MRNARKEVAHLYRELLEAGYGRDDANAVARDLEIALQEREDEVFMDAVESYLGNSINRSTAA